MNQPLTVTKVFIDFNTEKNFRDPWKCGLNFDAQTEFPAVLARR